jgi:glutamate-1-semialdehyde 2,1-aminomutase
MTNAPLQDRRNALPEQLLEFDESRRRLAEAAQFLAGGVSSNFRLGMQPTPLVFDRGDGAYLIDADGNRLIDYYLGMGPMILGPTPPDVIAAVQAQLPKGILFGGQGALEAEAARLICEMVPCAERIRFASSGSEAVQAALRIARAATGRRTVVKFAGHYHGWFDNILWSTTPPSDATGPVAGSRGQVLDAGIALDVLEWNDLEALRTRLAQGDVAMVIMEPMMCNQGGIHPLPGYLEGVREACTANGTILVFDEVVTGFRVAPGGAQQLFGVTPDLATFAKAVANGFPVAVIAGKAALLDQLAHGVMHGGTYNGQAVTMAATVATLRRLRDPATFEALNRCGTRLMEGMRARFAAAGVPAVVAGRPTIFHVGLGMTTPARNWASMASFDRPRYVAFTTALLRHGVRALERGAWFMSTEHDEAVVDATLEAVARALREI